MSFVRLDLEVGVFDFVERVGGAKARAGTPLEASAEAGFVNWGGFRLV